MPVAAFLGFKPEFRVYALTTRVRVCGHFKAPVASALRFTAWGLLKLLKAIHDYNGHIGRGLSVAAGREC